jgi:two-component system chemotaxis response regulator CheB
MDRRTSARPDPSVPRGEVTGARAARPTPAVSGKNDEAARALVVIGGSAGSIDVLRQVLAKMPPDFAAAIGIVIHVMPTRHSNLPHLFQRTSALLVSTAVDGAPPRPGRVVIAPSDHHLLVGEDAFRVGRGPKENGFRPAVDVLFRSAAAAYGPRTVGVILSGGLADGVRGARAIKQAGGRVIVQDPREAQFPEMPRSARPYADFVVGAGEMPALLVTLTEVAMRLRGERAGGAEEERRQLTELTCPECGGVLSELPDGMTYRCHVGHAYSEDSLLAHGHEMIEAGLWRAIRILNEQAKLLRMLAGKMAAQGSSRSAERFSDRAAEAEQSVAALRNVLLSSTILDLSEDDLHAGQPGDAETEAS